MEIVLYTRNDCEYCEQAKSLLRINNISYNELILERDITRDEVLKLFPEAKTLPLVIIDGIYIGGYNQLTDHLMNKQYGKGMI